MRARKRTVKPSSRFFQLNMASKPWEGAQTEITGEEPSRMLPLLTENSAPKKNIETATPSRMQPTQPLMKRKVS